MLWKAIVVGLIAVLARMDSRMLGRLNLERPLITCTVVGAFLGNIPTGLAVGATLEMVSLGFTQIGAAGFDMTMGAIVGCAIVIITGANLETALVIATPMSLLTTLIETAANTLRIGLVHLCDQYVDEGKFNKACSIDIFWGPVIYAVCTFVPVFIAIYLGADALNAALNIVPQTIQDGLGLGANLVAFFGFAMLLSIMMNRSNVIYYMLGFVIAAYSGLGLTAIAIISIVLSILLYSLKYAGGYGGQLQTAAQVEEHDELDD